MVYANRSAAAKNHQRSNNQENRRKNSVETMMIEFDAGSGGGEKRSRDEQDELSLNGAEDLLLEQENAAENSSVHPSPKKPKSLLGEEDSNKALGDHTPLMIGRGTEVWGVGADNDHESIDGPPRDGRDDNDDDDDLSI